MSGSGYSVTGGYWAMINVVQMPGVPNLVIIPNGANSVKLLWLDPATNSYTLQQNGNLATTSWVTSSFTFTNGLGTNYCTIAPPSRKFILPSNQALDFRLIIKLHRQSHIVIHNVTMSLANGLHPGGE